jgi:hypothetical protein
MAVLPPSPLDAATALENVGLTEKLALKVIQLYHRFSRSLNAPGAKIASRGEGKLR